MSSEELKPCPCGAACNTEEGPYPVNHARDLWRLDCVEPDCGWSIVAGSSEEALKDWNRRAPSALEAENARLIAMLEDWEADANLLEKERDAARAQLAAIQAGMNEPIEPCTDLNHHERYRAGWNACLAQHQRITAAMAAEVERLRADNGVVAHANLLRAQQAEQERDALRAELETLRKDASAEMFLTLTAELAKLRAELAEVKGREAN